jgi:hypothetical protein
MKYVGLVVISILIGMLLFFSCWNWNHKKADNEWGDENISLRLVQIQRHEETIEFVFQGRRLSLLPVWICLSNGGSTIAPAYESMIDKDSGKLCLRLTSFMVPKGIRLYQPLYGTYRKLPWQHSIEIRIPVTFPIGRRTPFYPTRADLVQHKLKAYGMTYRDIEKDSRLLEWAYTDLENYQQRLSYEELREITFEIGYYKRWWGFTSVWDIVRLINKDEVSVDCFWAKAHPEQKMTFTLTKSLIETFLSQPSP